MQPAGSNSGYLLGGFSDSPSGGSKSSPNYGLSDYWLVRVDEHGSVLWDRSYGGAEEDFLVVVKPSGQDWLLAGYSLSHTNGNKAAPQIGGRDFWVIKVDPGGDKLWERTLGGTSSEFLEDLVPTEDGGCLVAGYSFSGASGNKESPSQGFFDYWIVRLDAQGNKLWDRGYGGTSSDFLTAAAPAANGGFALAGYSLSDAGGNRSSPSIGERDWWFVLVDTNGNKTFEAAFGGTGDEVLNAMVATADGGFLLGGSSASGISGNKTSPNIGLDDFWTVRLDAAGSKLWDRSYGGAGQDVIWTLLERSDGRLLLGGWSASGVGGTKFSEPFGRSDWWLEMTDAQGIPLADQAYGGSGDEVVLALAPAGDDHVLLGGYSFSPQGDCKTSPQFGGGDFWVLKVQDRNVPEPVAPQLALLPQGAGDIDRDGYRFRVLGESNRCYVAEHSSDLERWTGFWTNLQTDPSVEVVDPSARSSVPRFYRVRLRR